jgi:hypothetical protein
VADDQTLSQSNNLTKGLGCEVSIDCSGSPAGLILTHKSGR